MKLLEWVQRRAAGTTEGVEHLSYKAEGARHVWLGEEKTPGKLYCSLLLLEGNLVTG